MSEIEIKVGARLSFDLDGEGHEGEVLTYREDRKNPGHSRLTVRGLDGRIHLLWAYQIAGAPPRIEGGPVDIEKAHTIARQHLAGERINIPVEDQLNTLSAAMLQLRRRAS